MSVQPFETTSLADLETHELEALTNAAAWYFDRHGRMIAEQADDLSAAAIGNRDDFYDLHSALWKLGIRLALPDGLPPRA